MRILQADVKYTFFWNSFLKNKFLIQFLYSLILLQNNFKIFDLMVTYPNIQNQWCKKIRGSYLIHILLEIKKKLSPTMSFFWTTKSLIGSMTIIKLIMSFTFVRYLNLRVYCKLVFFGIKTFYSICLFRGRPQRKDYCLYGKTQSY